VRLVRPVLRFCKKVIRFATKLFPPTRNKYGINPLISLHTFFDAVLHAWRACVACMGRLETANSTLVQSLVATTELHVYYSSVVATCRVE